MEFIIRLAGLPIRARAQHESTRDFCGGYLLDPHAGNGPASQDAADTQVAFEVDITQQSIEAERAYSDEHQARLGEPPLNNTDSSVEKTALLRAIAERLPAHDVVFMHGSALALDGVAYLFTGKSGAGKSTHARLWRQQFGPRVVMLNDDKPFLRVSPDGVVVYGTPWGGKHHISSNASAPLRAICLITQSPSNGIERLPAKDAWGVIMKQVYRPKDVQSGMLEKTLELVDRIAATTPVYRAQCTMDDEVVPLVHAALSSGA